MSIEGLFDHVASIFNPIDPTVTPPVVDRFGDTSNPFGAAVVERCAVVPPKLAQRDFGAGDTPSGRMDAYFRAGVVLQRKAVVKLTAGPESPSTWLVDDVNHPRGHHTEAVLIPWDGTAPE